MVKYFKKILNYSFLQIKSSSILTPRVVLTSATPFHCTRNYFVTDDTCTLSFLTNQGIYTRIPTIIIKVVSHRT